MHLVSKRKVKYLQLKSVNTKNNSLINSATFVDEENNYERLDVIVEGDIIEKLPSPKTDCVVELEAVQRNYRTYLTLVGIKTS